MEERIYCPNYLACRGEGVCCYHCSFKTECKKDINCYSDQSGGRKCEVFKKGQFLTKTEFAFRRILEK